MGPVKIDLGPGRADLKLVKAGLVPSKADSRRLIWSLSGLIGSLKGDADT